MMLKLTYFLNFEKAFDLLEYTSLETSLKKFGFPQYFINFVQLVSQMYPPVINK